MPRPEGLPESAEDPESGAEGRASGGLPIVEPPVEVVPPIVPEVSAQAPVGANPPKRRYSFPFFRRSPEDKASEEAKKNEKEAAKARRKKLEGNLREIANRRKAGKAIPDKKIEIDDSELAVETAEKIARIDGLTDEQVREEIVKASSGQADSNAPIETLRNRLKQFKQAIPVAPKEGVVFSSAPNRPEQDSIATKKPNVASRLLGKLRRGEPKKEAPDKSKKDGEVDKVSLQERRVFGEASEEMARLRNLSDDRARQEATEKFGPIDPKESIANIRFRLEQEVSPIIIEQVKEVEGLVGAVSKGKLNNSELREFGKKLTHGIGLLKVFGTALPGLLKNAAIQSLNRKTELGTGFVVGFATRIAIKSFLGITTVGVSELAGATAGGIAGGVKRVIREKKGYSSFMKEILGEGREITQETFLQTSQKLKEALSHETNKRAQEELRDKLRYLNVAFKRQSEKGEKNLFTLVEEMMKLQQGGVEEAPGEGALEGLKKVDVRDDLRLEIQNAKLVDRTKLRNAILIGAGFGLLGGFVGGSLADFLHGHDLLDEARKILSGASAPTGATGVVLGVPSQSPVGIPSQTNGVSSPTPRGIPGVTDTSTPRPSPTDSPSPTPRPSGPPEASGSPKPSGTPEASGSPKPSGTPEASASPKPSGTPVAETTGPKPGATDAPKPGTTEAPGAKGGVTETGAGKPPVVEPGAPKPPIGPETLPPETGVGAVIKISKEVAELKDTVDLPSGSNVWNESAKILKGLLGRDPTDAETLAGAKAIAKATKIAIPGWGLTEGTDQHLLRAGDPLNITPDVKKVFQQIVDGKLGVVEVHAPGVPSPETIIGVPKPLVGEIPTPPRPPVSEVLKPFPGPGISITEMSPTQIAKALPDEVPIFKGTTPLKTSFRLLEAALGQSPTNDEAMQFANALVKGTGAAAENVDLNAVATNDSVWHMGAGGREAIRQIMESPNTSLITAFKENATFGFPKGYDGAVFLKDFLRANLNLDISKPGFSKVLDVAITESSMSPEQKVSVLRTIATSGKIILPNDSSFKMTKRLLGAIIRYKLANKL